MSSEFMRSDQILRSEVDYRTNRVRNELRRSRRINRLRRAAADSIR